MSKDSSFLNGAVPTQEAGFTPCIVAVNTRYQQELGHPLKHRLSQCFHTGLSYRVQRHAGVEGLRPNPHQLTGRLGNGLQAVSE